MSEYGEPWHIGDDGHIYTADGHEAAIELDHKERIVACVNAMQGIPNPEAVRERIEHLASECDRLADSLQKPETTKGICAAFAQTIAADLRAMLSAPSTGAQQK